MTTTMPQPLILADATSRGGNWTRHPITTPGRRGAIVWAPEQSTAWRIVAVIVWVGGMIQLELVRQTKTHRDYARGGQVVVRLHEVRGWSNLWPQQNADLSMIAAQAAAVWGDAPIPEGMDGAYAERYGVEGERRPVEPSDHDRIMEAGQRGGWALYATTSTHHGYRRGAVMILATFDEAGALVTGSLRVDGVRTPLDTQRAGRVVMWLEEEVADHQDDDSRWGRDGEAPGDVVDDGPADGTYPTLEAAEHGQPLASLERLETLANAALITGHERALVCDHASTVRQRIAELETQLAESRRQEQRTEAARARLAQDLVEANARNARNTVAYREVRERVTELEDQRGPARARFHDLVEALREQQPGPSFRVVGRMAQLATTLGVSIRPLEPAAIGTPVHAAVERAGGARPVVPLVLEAVRELELVGGAPTVRTVLQAQGVDVPISLPGERVVIREFVPQATGRPLVRVIGELVVAGAPDGADVLRTGEGVRAYDVPAELVAGYLTAVRAAGYPAPQRRRDILADVMAGRLPAR